MRTILSKILKKRIAFVPTLIFLFITPFISKAQYCTPTYTPTGTWAGFDGCGSSGTFPLGHYITNVTIGSINNSVSNGNCTDNDFTAQTTVVYDDGTCAPTPMTVMVNGYCGVTVAVDLNNDFDFDDPGEIVIPNSYVAASPATYTLGLPIPAGTSVGPHRMRVYNAGANSNNATGGACGVFDFGSFHDYTIDVQHNPNPVTFQTTIDTALCAGQSFVYNGIAYSTSQQILDTLQSVTGCDSFLAINLHILPLPVTNIQQTLCSGGSTVFGGQTINTSGTYYDTLQTGLGCDSVIILSLTVVPMGTVQTIDQEICEGDSFAFAGNALFTSGQYFDTLTSVMGCDSFISILNLTVNPLPVINASYHSAPAPQLCIGDIVTIQAQGASSYHWYDMTGRLVGNQPQFDYMLPASHNTLIVTGTSQSNCVAKDTISIDANVCCTIEIPTIFSPNGDGVNDFFKPIYLGNPRSYYISIFNRWGQLVYKSYDINAGWDGRSESGKAMDIDIYYWHMQATCANGLSIDRKGDITLVR